MTELKCDSTVFVLRQQGKIELICGTHVDDLLFAGSKHGTEVIQSLQGTFPIKSWEFGNFVYCGRRFQQDPKTFEVSIGMADYASKIASIEIDRSRKDELESPCTEAEHSRFRSCLGALSWLASNGRPDLAFQVSRLQGCASAPLVKHLGEANSVVKAAKRHQEVTLRFPPLNLKEINFLAVSDASFASMTGGKSQTGYFVLAADPRVGQGQRGTIVPLCWRSSRQKRVCRSTFGAETLALSDSVDAADFTRGFYHELITGEEGREALDHGAPLAWATDCKDLFDALTKSGVPDCAEKRLILEVVILRELLSRPNNTVRWISTTQMLADGLTKAMDTSYIRERLASAEWCYTEDSSVAKRTKSSSKNLPVHLSTPSSGMLRCPHCNVVHEEPSAQHRFVRGFDLWRPHKTHWCHGCGKRWSTAKPTLGTVAFRSKSVSERATCRSTVSLSDRLLASAGILAKRRRSRVSAQNS
jgi:hypothetical protein